MWPRWVSAGAPLPFERAKQPTPVSSCAGCKHAYTNVRRSADASQAVTLAHFAMGGNRGWPATARLFGTVLDLQPSIVDALPSWLGWFGRPGSMPTLGIVVTVLIGGCVLTFRSDRSRQAVGVSFTVIAVLDRNKCGPGPELILGLSRRQPSGLLHPAHGDSPVGQRRHR